MGGYPDNNGTIHVNKAIDELFKKFKTMSANMTLVVI